MTNFFYFAWFDSGIQYMLHKFYQCTGTCYIKAYYIDYPNISIFEQERSENVYIYREIFLHCFL